MTRPQAHKLLAGVQRRRHPRAVVEHLCLDPAEARDVLTDAGQGAAAAEVARMLEPRGRGRD